MSRVYVMNNSEEAMRAAIEMNPASGLEVKHKPFDESGKPSLWPYSVTDGKYYGFFEGAYILFWGANDERGILESLRKMGFRVMDSF